MALRNKRRATRPEANKKEIKNNTPKKKTVVYSISQMFRNLSISVNLTVYTIYLVYLIYSIINDVGIKFLNIALALATAAFIVVYLVLRLSGKKRGKELKQIKRYYKDFKLITRAVSTVTAVYALLTAFTSVSPLAIILAFLGAVFIIIRLIVELVLYLIKRKIRKIKDNITGRRAEEEYEDENPDNTAAKRRRRRRKIWEIGKKDDNLEDIVVPVDQCLLNDVDEDSTLFDSISLNLD